MANAGTALAQYNPPNREEALDTARQSIEQELAAICELAEPIAERPDTSRLWELIGSLNEVAADLRRLRRAMEESRSRPHASVIE